MYSIVLNLHLFFFFQNDSENDGYIPDKYGNLELMKIPNFLHLTPPHIKKQCAALKGILNCYFGNIAFLLLNLL